MKKTTKHHIEQKNIEDQIGRMIPAIWYSIAIEGVRFTNVYLTASSCSPSRISIMTGRYPHNTGAAELHTEPNIDFPTIAGKLRENGYYTAQAGKWHMCIIFFNGVKR